MYYMLLNTGVKYFQVMVYIMSLVLSKKWLAKRSNLSGV